MEWDCSGHSTAAAQMEDETTHVRSDRRKCLGNMGVDVPLHRRVPAALTRQTPYHYWHVFSSDDASTEDEEGVGESMAVESEVCVLGNSCVAHACTLCGIFSAGISSARSQLTSAVTRYTAGRSHGDGPGDAGRFRDALHDPAPDFGTKETVLRSGAWVRTGGLGG